MPNDPEADVRVSGAIGLCSYKDVETMRAYERAPEKEEDEHVREMITVAS